MRNLNFSHEFYTKDIPGVRLSVTTQGKPCVLRQPYPSEKLATTGDLFLYLDLTIVVGITRVLG